MKKTMKKIVTIALVATMVLTCLPVGTYASVSEIFRQSSGEETTLDKLKALIEEAKKLKESDYTAESWAEFYDVLDSIDNPDEIPEQYQQAVLDNLQEAINGLVRKETTLDKLKALIEEAKKLKESDYTAESWAEFYDTLDSIDNPDEIPEQYQQIVLDNLQDAINNLVKKETTLDKLKALIEEAKKLKESDYTAESWAEFYDVLDSIDNPDEIPEQYQQIILNNLQEAMNELVKVSVYDKLESKIQDAEKLNPDDYTTDSWNKVKNIIDSISRPVSSDNISEQEANTKLSELNNAIDALKDKTQEITLEDGTYIASPTMSGTLASNVKKDIKIVAKDGRYQITIYTKEEDVWSYEGGMKSNKQYKKRDKSDYSYPLIEALKKEYSSDSSSIDDKYSMKNIIDGYDLNNSTYDDTIKSKFSAENDDLYYDSVYGYMKDCHTVTFETDSLDGLYYVHAIFGYDEYNYAGDKSKKEYRFYGSIEFNKDCFIKLPESDDLSSLEGTYINNNSNIRTFGDLAAEVKVVEGKLNVTYSIDPELYIGTSTKIESVKFLDMDENPLDVSNNKFTIVYNNYDELIAGKDIYIEASAIDTYRGNVTLHYIYTVKPEFRYKPVTLTDASTGIKLHSTTQYLSEDAQLNVSMIKDSGSTDSKTDVWANAQSNIPKHNGEYFFKIEVTDNGKKVTNFGANILLDIPKADNINDNAIRLFMNHWDEEQEGFEFGWFNQNICSYADKYSVIVDNRYTDANWFIYDEKLSDSDGKNLADGTYEVPITTFNKSQPGQTSMSAKCLGEKATLVVKNGVKRLELNFNPVDIGEQQGYLIQMWKWEDNEWKELTYTSYYKNADGSYYTDELNAGTNNYYPKTAYMILPTDDAQFSTKFRVSAMDSIMAGSGDATRDAIFTIYYDQAEKISDATPDAPEEEIPNFKEADKTKLTELVNSVKGIKGDEYTTSSYENLQSVLANAVTMLDNKKASQTEVDNMYESLNTAFKGLAKKQNTGLDYKNLPDGVYKLNVNMVKIDKVTASMSDGAIEHTVALTVKDGKYYLTVNFKGLRIGSDFGYLRELKYYLTGYTLDKYGNPVGELADTTVEGYWKNEDGTLVSDIYGSDYPNALTFELIPEALENGYVPLQVFVPVMEAISEGTGEQNVFMKLDWTSLAKTTADDPELKPAEPAKQLPAFSKTDDATGVKVDAAKGSFDTEVRFIVAPVTTGDVYSKAETALSEVGKKFKVFDIHFEDANGNAVQPNGKVTISLPIPEGYDASKVVLYRINDDGTKTLVKGSVENGYYKADTKHFSTYALVEKGSTITDADNTAQIEANKSAESIKTGDSANTILWAAVLMLAVAGMAGTFAVRRRKVKEQ